MQHTYTVTGMTCNGCKSSVEDKLIALPNVISASVSLENAEATIEMAEHISIEKLQNTILRLIEIIRITGNIIINMKS